MLIFMYLKQIKELFLIPKPRLVKLGVILLVPRTCNKVT